MVDGLFGEGSGESAVPLSWAPPPHYVGFWYRVLAYLVDSWLLMLGVGGVFALMSEIGRAHV